MSIRAAAWLLTAALLTVSTSAQAQGDVEIEATELATGIYMLTGSGGNLAACVGEDGVFLVDDQFAPLTQKIQAKLGTLSDQPVRFVINTHWHGDHTGGNENFANSGTLVVAHDNVRVRMSADHFNEVFDRETKAAPEAARPVVTFDETVTFHYNGEEIHAFHVVDAHTDGDSMIHFRNANVLHMGDVYFNGLYPFIDKWSGGSLAGTIAAVKNTLEMINDDTIIIPGHGAASNREELRVYLAMLEDVHATIKKEVDAGKTKEEVIAAKPTAKYDEKWGQAWLNGDKFVEIVYAGLTDK